MSRHRATTRRMWVTATTCAAVTGVGVGGWLGVIVTGVVL